LSVSSGTVVTASITPGFFVGRGLRSVTRALVVSALTLIILVGFGFRAVRLGSEGLSEDELNKLTAVGNDFPGWRHRSGVCIILLSCDGLRCVLLAMATTDTKAYADGAARHANLLSKRGLTVCFDRRCDGGSDVARFLAVVY
jgi:hypothetical protein